MNLPNGIGAYVGHYSCCLPSQLKSIHAYTILFVFTFSHLVFWQQFLDLCTQLKLSLDPLVGWGWDINPLLISHTIDARSRRLAFGASSP